MLRSWHSGRKIGQVMIDDVGLRSLMDDAAQAEFVCFMTFTRTACAVI
jgi:hypothetical protein